MLYSTFSFSSEINRKQEQNHSYSKLFYCQCKILKRPICSCLAELACLKRYFVSKYRKLSFRKPDGPWPFPDQTFESMEFDPRQFSRTLKSVWFPYLLIVFVCFIFFRHSYFSIFLKSIISRFDRKNCKNFKGWQSGAPIRFTQNPGFFETTSEN